MALWKSIYKTLFSSSVAVPGYRVMETWSYLKRLLGLVQEVILCWCSVIVLEGHLFFFTDVTCANMIWVIQALYSGYSSFNKFSASNSFIQALWLYRSLRWESLKNQLTNSALGIFIFNKSEELALFPSILYQESGLWSPYTITLFSFILVLHVAFCLICSSFHLHVLV